MTDEKAGISQSQNWVIILEQFIEYMSSYSDQDPVVVNNFIINNQNIIFGENFYDIFEDSESNPHNSLSQKPIKNFCYKNTLVTQEMLQLIIMVSKYIRTSIYFVFHFFDQMIQNNPNIMDYFKGNQYTQNVQTYFQVSLQQMLSQLKLKYLNALQFFFSLLLVKQSFIQETPDLGILKSKIDLQKITKFLINALQSTKNKSLISPYYTINLQQYFQQMLKELQYVYQSLVIISNENLLIQNTENCNELLSIFWEQDFRGPYQQLIELFGAVPQTSFQEEQILRQISFIQFLISFSLFTLEQPFEQEQRNPSSIQTLSKINSQIVQISQQEISNLPEEKNFVGIMLKIINQVYILCYDQNQTQELKKFMEQNFCELNFQNFQIYFSSFINELQSLQTEFSFNIIRKVLYRILKYLWYLQAKDTDCLSDLFLQSNLNQVFLDTLKICFESQEVYEEFMENEFGLWSVIGDMVSNFLYSYPMCLYENYEICQITQILIKNADPGHFVQIIEKLKNIERISWKNATDWSQCRRKPSDNRKMIKERELRITGEPLLINGENIDSQTDFYVEKENIFYFNQPINFLEKIPQTLIRVIDDFKNSQTIDFDLFDKFFQLFCQIIQSNVSIIEQFSNNQTESIIQTISIIFWFTNILSYGVENVQTLQMGLKTIIVLLKSQYWDFTLIFIKGFLNKELQSCPDVFLTRPLKLLEELKDKNIEVLLENQSCIWRCVKMNLQIINHLFMDPSMWSSLVQKSKDIPIQQSLFAKIDKIIFDDETTGSFSCFNFQEVYQMHLALDVFSIWDLFADFLDCIQKQIITPVFQQMQNLKTFTGDSQKQLASCFKQLLLGQQLAIKNLMQKPGEKRLYLDEDSDAQLTSVQKSIQSFVQQNPIIDTIIYILEIQLIKDTQNITKQPLSNGKFIRNSIIAQTESQNQKQKQNLKLLEQTLGLLDTLLRIAIQFKKFDNRVLFDIRKQIYDFLSTKENFYCYIFHDYSQLRKINLIQAIISLLYEKDFSLMDQKVDWTQAYLVGFEISNIQSSIDLENIIQPRASDIALYSYRPASYSMQIRTTLHERVFSVLNQVLKLWKTEKHSSFFQFYHFLSGNQSDLKDDGQQSQLFSYKIFEQLNRQSITCVKFLISLQSKNDLYFSYLMSLNTQGEKERCFLDIISRNFVDFQGFNDKIVQKIPYDWNYFTILLRLVSKILINKNIKKQINEMIVQKIGVSFLNNLLINIQQLQNIQKLYLGISSSFLQDSNQRLIFEKQCLQNGQDQYKEQEMDIDESFYLLNQIDSNIKLFILTFYYKVEKNIFKSLKNFLYAITDQIIRSIGLQSKSNTESILYLKPETISQILCLSQEFSFNECANSLDLLNRLNKNQYIQLRVDEINNQLSDSNTNNFGEVLQPKMQLIHQNKSNKYSYQLFEFEFILSYQGINLQSIQGLLVNCLLGNQLSYHNSFKDTLSKSLLLVQQLCSLFTEKEVVLSNALSIKIYQENIQTIKNLYNQIYNSNTKQKQYYLEHQLQKLLENFDTSKQNLTQTTKVNKFEQSDFEREFFQLMPKIKLDLQMSFLYKTNQVDSENNFNKISNEFMSEKIYNQIENIYGGLEQYYIANQQNSISINHVRNIFEFVVVHIQNALASLSEIADQQIADKTAKYQVLIDDMFKLIILMENQVIQSCLESQEFLKSFTNIVYYLLEFLKQTKNCKFENFYNTLFFMCQNILEIKTPELIVTQKIVSSIEILIQYQSLSITEETINKFLTMLVQQNQNLEIKIQLIKLLITITSNVGYQEIVLNTDFINQVFEIQELKALSEEQQQFYQDDQYEKNNVLFLYLLWLINQFSNNQLDNPNMFQFWTQFFNIYKNRFEFILSLGQPLDQENLFDKKHNFELKTSFRSLAYLETLEEVLRFITFLSNMSDFWVIQDQSNSDFVFYSLITRVLRLFDQENINRNQTQNLKTHLITAEKFTPQNQYESFLNKVILTSDQATNYSAQEITQKINNINAFQQKGMQNKMDNVYWSKNCSIISLFNIQVDFNLQQILFLSSYILQQLIDQYEVMNAYDSDQYFEFIIKRNFTLSNLLIVAQQYIVYSISKVANYYDLLDTGMTKLLLYQQTIQAHQSSHGVCEAKAYFSLQEQIYLSRKTLEMILYIQTILTQSCHLDNYEIQHQIQNDLKTNKNWIKSFISEFGTYLSMQTKSVDNSIKSPFKSTKWLSTFKNANEIFINVQNNDSYLLSANSLKEQEKHINALSKAFE